MRFDGGLRDYAEAGDVSEPLSERRARYPSDLADAGERQSTASLLYVTDRVADEDTAENRSYSVERTPSMAFGESAE